MKYCANLHCPHRERVGSPAEFLDRVFRCSDCATRLVGSEEDAIAGRSPAQDPYRGAASVADEARAATAPKGGDAAQGMLLVLGGLVLTTLAYALAARAHGAWVVAAMPLLYGVFCLARARADRG